MAEHPRATPGRMEEELLYEHASIPPLHNYHAALPSCKQDKVMVMLLRGEVMDKLFRHVGMVEDDDTYNEVVSDRAVCTQKAPSSAH